MALFWLPEREWAAIAPHLAKNQPGAKTGGWPADDFGHTARAEGRLPLMRLPCRLRPSTTAYNRFNRWSRRSFWLKLLDALVDAGATARSTAIDSNLRPGAAGSVRRKKGRSAQAIGRWRGGRTTRSTRLLTSPAAPSHCDRLLAVIAASLGKAGLALRASAASGSAIHPVASRRVRRGSQRRQSCRCGNAGNPLAARTM
jgi:hypothetical protein